MFQPLCPQASFRLYVGFLMPAFFVPYGEAGQGSMQIYES